MSSPRRRTIKKSLSLASPRKSILASHIHTAECKHCGNIENEEIPPEPEVVVDKIITIEIEEEEEEQDILEKMKIVIDK